MDKSKPVLSGHRQYVIARFSQPRYIEPVLSIDDIKERGQ